MQTIASHVRGFANMAGFEMYTLQLAGKMYCVSCLSWICLASQTLQV